ncbi:MAG TPA: serine hydrolase [Candidatus Rubrimentiphilum sp.]|nr:serine hydrolase [Candidatus Rubrimentiphilum sp.]
MRILIAIVFALCCVRPAPSQPDRTLLRALTQTIASYQGKVALYAVDLKTGKTIAINADTPVPTASVIKLTVLFEALKQLESGQVHWDDRLTLQKTDQVIGSGVLRLFDTPMPLTFKDAVTLMIDLSDNTATNLVIDHLGLQNIDNRIQWMGLQNTWLYKKVFQAASGPVPADQPKFGLGKTTAHEMATVMQRFATCNLAAAGAPPQPTPEEQSLCNAALGILKGQFDQNDIPRYLSNLQIANKTGALNDVRNDVGVVYAPNGPVIISAFTYDNRDQSWTADNAGQLLIGKLAKAIIQAWN